MRLSKMKLRRLIETVINEEENEKGEVSGQACKEYTYDPKKDYGKTVNATENTICIIVKSTTGQGIAKMDAEAFAGDEYELSKDKPNGNLADPDTNTYWFKFEKKDKQ